MVIPSPTSYPTDLDVDQNLFAVHDGLRLTLSDDYEPGDTSIKFTGDLLVASNFPQSGLITLTEQCSDIDERAISFFYSSVDVTTLTISGLELLPDFKDVSKPKSITHITLNVMSQHHNHLKDALIAIEEFIGIKDTIDAFPFGPTLEGRINFLRRLVLVPRAWFTSDKRIGLTPFEVEFNDLSFRLGTDGTAGPISITWDLGDGLTSTIPPTETITATSRVPDESIGVFVLDEDQGKIKKVYHTPGIYTVKMTVKNDFGEETCVFPDYITARTKAPNEAIIKFVADSSTQTATGGTPQNGPFQTFPKVRSPINTLINIEIPEGANPNLEVDTSSGTLHYSYAGELLNEHNGSPIDPIEFYTWSLGDDLTHVNSKTTAASYGVGGIYDLALRADTEFGAYRITTYENVIDIIENTNLWLWMFADETNVRSYEFGLISETFKTTEVPTYIVNRDSSFLTDTSTNPVPEEERQKREFERNVGFIPKSVINSGRQGSGLIYYATGRSDIEPKSAESIKFVEYEGFSGTYTSRSDLTITRPWNWTSFHGKTDLLIAFGTSALSSFPANTSPTHPDKTQMNLSHGGTESVTQTIGTPTASCCFKNGADELLENPSIFDNGQSVYGDFSVYRSASNSNNVGFLLRNDGVGPFFRLRSFYRTEGTVGEPFSFFSKKTDLQGPTKVEGQMTDLSAGIYFFSNSGSVSAYNDTTAIWSVGGPGLNSIAYRSIQDTSVSGFDDQENTLLCSSDKDKRAYLSFDYSNKVVLKFSELDLTFSLLPSRPTGKQWFMATY